MKRGNFFINSKVGLGAYDLKKIKIAISPGLNLLNQSLVDN